MSLNIGLATGGDEIIVDLDWLNTNNTPHIWDNIDTNNPNSIFEIRNKITNTVIFLCTKWIIINEKYEDWFQKWLCFLEEEKLIEFLCYLLNEKANLKQKQEWTKQIPIPFSF
jgi:hypothetical protein